jgi:hypothetical protein
MDLPFKGACSPDPTPSTQTLIPIKTTTVTEYDPTPAPSCLNPIGYNIKPLYEYDFYLIQLHISSQSAL